MFRFQLEQVLNVRKLAEEKVMQEFSEQVRNLEREKDRLRSIRGEKATVLEGLMSRKSGNLNADEIGLTFRYIRSLREREVAQVILVADRERALQTKREELAETMKRRKILEHLKQKKFGQYWKDRNRRESVELNDQSIIRFLKRSDNEKADSDL